MLYQEWANLKLLDHLKSVPSHVLEQSIEGTGGSIKQIFSHMLEQERWGLGVLGAGVAAEPSSAADVVRRHAAGWLWVLENLNQLNDSALPAAGSGFEKPIPVFATMYFIQTVHHQELHRTHIRSTLDVLDHSIPGTDPTDVWAYWVERHGAVLPAAG